MIRISICEDIPEELYMQKRQIQLIMAELSKNIELFCFQSGEDLLFEIDMTGNMDIIFLDVKMPGMNGIETAKKIRDKDTEVVLIFVSSYEQYCKEMIGVQPFAFIDKPVSTQRVEAVLKYVLQTRFDFAERYRFSFHKKQYHIPLTKIRYFQSDKRIIHVDVLSEGAPFSQYMFYGRLEEVERSVNKTSVRFIRIRKSFLVNPQYIVEYSANQVIMDNGIVIEISKNYKNSVRQYYISILKHKI